MISSSPIFLIPRILIILSLSKLLNASILRLFEFLKAVELIAPAAYIVINLVTLFIAGQLLPALRSGDEEAFAMQILFLNKL